MAPRPEMMTGPTNPVLRLPDHMTSTLQQPNNQRRPLVLDDADEEPEQFKNPLIDHDVTDIIVLHHILQRDAAYTRILKTQVLKFGNFKDKFQTPPTQSLEATAEQSH